MNWRGLHLSEAAKLSVKQNQLLLERKDGRYTFPLEDIAFLILDTQQISLTAALIASCAEHGCLVISCDAKHIPCGALLPYHNFHRHTETLLAQLAMSEPRRKRLWQSIVRRKIRNQAECLIRAGRPGEQVAKVAVLESKVKSGDTDNTEGVAARLYWHCWVAGFSREQDAEDRLNVMLNYGYALVRALIARELAARGFSPSFGLHHHSMGNAFNLADDLLEPWRPFVDRLALEHWTQSPQEEEFTLADRRALTKIFHTEVAVEGAVMTLLDAVRKQVEQFRAFCLKTRDDIALPSFPQ